MVGLEAWNQIDLPGDETEVESLLITIVLLSVDGVACMVIRRRPGRGLVPWVLAAHCLGWLERR